MERDTVGTPLHGVEVRVGDDPTQPFEPERVGRIWARGPGQMAGYGFPPHVERPGDVDGWWPTRDLGRVRADGYLVLAGRIDDAIRTRDNRTVNLAHVAASFGQLAAVRDAVVVRSGGRRRPVRSLGAVVGSRERRSTAATLPGEAGLGAAAVVVAPRVIRPVAASYRGCRTAKPDRQACARLLAERMPRGWTNGRSSISCAES